jgi:hypothetical protein
VDQFRGQLEVGEAARTPAVFVTHEEPPSSKSTFDSRTGFAHGHAMTAWPGRGLIQRGGDASVTCRLAATALTSSSATVAADFAATDVTRAGSTRWADPRLTAIH